MATKEEVAQRMVATLNETGFLTQKKAAREVREAFGEEFVYKNENKHWAIKPEVLDEFRNLTGDGVVWEQGVRRWRLRRETDKPGRKQK